MKRVCIVRHNYYPDETHLRRDAETLLRHNYEVDVICLRKNGQKTQETSGGVNVYRLPVEHHRRGIVRYVTEYLEFFLHAFWKLSWLQLKRRYDVIEVDNMPDFLVFTTLVPKLLGAKVIFYVFDNMPEVCVDHFMVSPGHPAIRLLRLIERISAKWADRVIATQSVSKELLESRGVPESKISIVLNVPDESMLDKLSFSPSSNGNNFCLMTHGSLVERYGVKTLVKAIPLLTDDIPELKVMIVGDGEDKPRLEEMAQFLGVSEYVEFTGWVTVETVLSYIAQSHIGVVVIPAGANPAIPNKLFDYLALGEPTVVTAIPTIKRYFDDDSIMFYEPDNEQDLARCILELYRNPEKREALAASSSAIYQKYRWPVMQYEYLKVFGELTKDKSSEDADSVREAG